MTKLPRRRFLHLAAGAAALPAVLRSARAQTYPERPVRIIIPLGPGGVGDIMMRIVAEQLSERFGKAFFIENMPSADNLTAMRAVIKSASDGYTLMLLTGGLAASIALYKQFPVDVLSAFEPISSMGYFDCLMVVNAKSKFKSLGDFLDVARGKPGTLNVGTVSSGSVQHFTATYLKQASGVDFVIVPFRTTPDAIVALMRDDVQVVIDFYAALKPGLVNQQLRAIAWAGPTPSPALPDVETAGRQGVQGFAVQSWNALYAKTGTPPGIVAALNDALRAVLADADVKSRLLDIGIDSKASTPAEMDAQLRSDVKKWTEVVDRAGIEKH